MKDCIKQKLKDLRDRVMHRAVVLVIRGVARTYGIKLPDVKPGAHLILGSKQYQMMFSNKKMPPKNKFQMLGWQWLGDRVDNTNVN